mgnify:CR=1 FL=1|jgi:hypothetical protein
MTDAPETKWLTPNGGLPTGAPWPKSELVEYTRTDISQARIAELEAALATARNDAFQEAANACCHPTNVHDGGASAICRGRVLAALKAKP